VGLSTSLTRQGALDPEAFEKVFHMTKAAFYGLKTWRQIELKKKYGYF